MKGLFKDHNGASRIGAESVQVESDGLLRITSTASAWSEEEDEGESQPIPGRIVALVWGLFRLLLHRPYINPRDHLLLSPWQKWRKYNRIPYKVTMHVLLFLLVFTQVVLLYVETAGYNRASQKTLSNTFLGGELLDSDDYYTIDELYHRIKNVTLSYYNIQSLLVGKFVHRHHQNSTDYQPVHMEAQFFRRPLFNETSRNFAVSNDLDLEKKSYKLTPEHPTGPFNMSEPDVFHRLYRMSISFHLLSLNIGLIGPIPYDWHIRIHYTVTGAAVTATLYAEPTVFEVSGYFPLSLFIGFHAAVMIFAIVTFLLELKSAVSSLKIFLKVRRKYKSIPRMTRKSEGYPKWGKIPSGVKLRFVRLWTLWTMLTCLCLISGSILGLTQVFGYNVTTVYLIFQGLGVFGITMVVLRYLEYIQSLYTLLLTLRVSFWKIIRLIIDSSPFYLAYTLMGVTLFSSHSVRFSSIQDTSVTLFSLLNGDAIRDAFDDLIAHYPYPIIAQIYLYTFVALFITAILNVFIFIIEDAYHTAKEARTANSGDGERDGGLGNPVEGHGGRKKHGRKKKKDIGSFSIQDLFHVLEREFGDTLFRKHGHADEKDKLRPIDARENETLSDVGIDDVDLDLERAPLIDSSSLISDRPTPSLIISGASPYSSNSAADRSKAAHTSSSDEEAIDLSQLAGIAGGALSDVAEGPMRSMVSPDTEFTMIQLNKLREDMMDAIETAQDEFFASFEEHAMALREQHDVRLTRRLNRLFEKVRVQMDSIHSGGDVSGSRQRRSRSVTSSPTQRRRSRPRRRSVHLSRSHSGVHLQLPFDE